MKFPCADIECNSSFDCCVILGILNLPVKNTECAAEVTSGGIVSRDDKKNGQEIE